MKSKLTDDQRSQLEALVRKPDEEIDFSDIPELKELPSEVYIGKFYRPKKETVTIRLDADVLAWMRSLGEGYQTQINAYLRAIMRRSQQKRPR
jgi:uncharacterized protein (DUF4415 family)